MLKRQLLKSLEQQGPLAEFPDAYWRVMGSSLFPVRPARLITYESFATPDIDLQICAPSNPMAGAAKPLEHAAERALNIAVRSLGVEKARPGAWRIGEDAVNPRHFYIKKHFSAEEAATALADQPELVALVDGAGVDVTLEIHNIPYMGISPLLNPKPKPGPKGVNHIRFDDPRQYLSRILMRSIRPGDFHPTEEGYKPSDVIHAYKLLHPDKRDDPHVRCYERRQGDGDDHILSDRRLMRLLCVVNFAAMDVSPRMENINAYYPESHENIELFKRGILNYPSFRVAVLPYDARLYVENMYDLYHLIFPSAPGSSRSEPLSFELSENEAQFLEALQPSDPESKPQLRIDLLKDEYPEVFAEYPELEKNIVNSRELQQAMGGRTWRAVMASDARGSVQSRH